MLIFKNLKCADCTNTLFFSGLISGAGMNAAVAFGPTAVCSIARTFTDKSGNEVTKECK